MRAAVLSLSLVGCAVAENGRHSTYGYAGALDGSHWMSETQPTTNDCSDQPPDIRSPYCGPGFSRAQQANVKASTKGFELTTTMSANRTEASFAQLYLCRSEAQCARRDGTTDLHEAVKNQQPLGPGTYVFQVDSFTSNYQDGIFPNEAVLGLYLYRPNMTLQGNVDGSNEIDIEYHNWGPVGNSTVWFTTWPKSVTGHGRMATTDSGVPSAAAFPRCMAFRWAAGQSVQFGLWPLVDGACDPEDCFGRDDCATTEHKSSQVPIEHMIPAINLWWYGDLEAIPADASVSVTVSGFKFFPSEVLYIL